MPSGKEMLNEMEFRREIAQLEDRELSEFIALQTWEIAGVQSDHGNRIYRLEKKSRRITGWVGTVGVLIGAIVVGIIDFFIRR